VVTTNQQQSFSWQIAERTLSATSKQLQRFSISENNKKAL
jgi:hypothetical protein